MLTIPTVASVDYDEVIGALDLVREGIIKTRGYIDYCIWTGVLKPLPIVKYKTDARLRLDVHNLDEVRIEIVAGGAHYDAVSCMIDYVPLQIASDELGFTLNKIDAIRSDLGVVESFLSMPKKPTRIQYMRAHGKLNTVEVRELLDLYYWRK